MAVHDWTLVDAGIFHAFHVVWSYVNVPLEATYQAAYRSMPAFWRNVLEGGQSPSV